MGEYCHCPGDCVGARVPRHTGFPLPPLWDLGGEQVLGSASVSRWQAKAYRGAPGPGSWKRQGWTWVLSLSKEGLLHLSGQGGLPGGVVSGDAAVPGYSFELPALCSRAVSWPLLQQGPQLLSELPVAVGRGQPHRGVLYTLPSCPHPFSFLFRRLQRHRGGRWLGS